MGFGQKPLAHNVNATLTFQIVWGQTTGRLPDPPPGSNVRIVSLDQVWGVKDHIRVRKLI